MSASTSTDTTTVADTGPVRTSGSVGTPLVQHPPGSPPRRGRRRRRLVAGAVLAVAVASAGLSGCGKASGTTTSSYSTNCSGDACRTVVSSAPTTVSDTETRTRTTSTKKAGTKTRTRASETIDFTVTAMAPGTATVSSDGRAPAPVAVGTTFTADGEDVTLEASDGRTATFTFVR